MNPTGSTKVTQSVSKVLQSESKISDKSYPNYILYFSFSRFLKICQAIEGRIFYLHAHKYEFHLNKLHLKYLETFH